jgi:hypothetical protein
MLAVSVGLVRGIPRRAIRVGVLLVILALAALVTRNLVVNAGSGSGAVTVHSVVPQNAQLENALGVRFNRVAVVGDGGLITVSYVVLDAQKATEFQSDIAHPPVLSSESRKGSTRRVSLMRQGHNLRDGQTYYLVYQDTRAAIRSGEKVTISKGNLALAHVPVL